MLLIYFNASVNKPYCNVNVNTFYVNNSNNTNLVKFKILGQMLNPMGCCNDRHRFVLDKLECYQMIVHVPPNQTLGIAKCAGEVTITRYLFNWLILCSRGCSLGF